MAQLLQAPSDQPGVTFNVTSGGSEAAGGIFRCQYGVIGEHSQPQLSDLSQPVQISFPGKIPCRTLVILPLPSLGCFHASPSLQISRYEGKEARSYNGELAFVCLWEIPGRQKPSDQGRARTGRQGGDPVWNRGP